MNRPGRTFFLLGIMLLMILLPACKGREDPFDPPDFTPTKAPAAWMTIGPNIDYRKVKAVRPEAMPARRIELPAYQNSELLLPLSDGGCLSISTVAVDEKDTSGSPSFHLRAIRFKSDGSKRWERDYKSDPFQGYAVTMCVFSDDGFAVSLRVAHDGPSGFASLLWRFAPDGTPLWRSNEGDIDVGALEHLMATPDGSVIAAGTHTTMKSDGSFDKIDISLLRFDPTGSLSKRLVFDSNGSDTLLDADYDAALGLILTWHSEEDFHLSLYDERFTRVWQKDMPSSYFLHQTDIASGGHGFFVFGTVRNPSADVDSSFLSSISFFDTSGTQLWTESLKEPNHWLHAAAALSDGRIVTGESRPSGDFTQKAVVTLLTESGTIERELDGIPGSMLWIHATRDGGFTVCVRQTVRGLPQPPFVSSMWMDTEAILSHYDDRFELIWRRTIDQYKHDTRSDFIITTEDDRLLIG